MLGLALLSLLSLPFTVWVTLMLPNLLLGLWVLVLVREELRGVGWRRGMRAHILLITCAGLIAATTVAAASSPWLGLLSEL